MEYHHENVAKLQLLRKRSPNHPITTFVTLLLHSGALCSDWLLEFEISSLQCGSAVVPTYISATVTMLFHFADWVGVTADFPIKLG